MAHDPRAKHQNPRARHRQSAPLRREHQPVPLDSAGDRAKYRPPEAKQASKGRRARDRNRIDGPTIGEGLLSRRGRLSTRRSTAARAPAGRDHSTGRRCRPWPRGASAPSRKGASKGGDHLEKVRPKAVKPANNRRTTGRTSFGGGSLEPPRPRRGAPWLGLTLGVPSCPEPPGAP